MVLMPPSSRLKDAFVGSAGLLVTLLVNGNPVPPVGEVTLWTMTVAQLVMSTGLGAMKSLTSAGNDDDERLFRNALPNAVQVPAGKTPAAVRLMAASPNRPVPRVPPATASLTVPVLTAPSAKPAALRSTRLPQQGRALVEKHWEVAPAVTHFSRPRVGVPLPPKS